MNPFIVEYPLGDNPPSAKLFYGIDVIEGLKLLPDQSVQMVATSPPYWSLRDYGVKGQIGLEDTPKEYVQRLVAVFTEVRRVLRDDGTVWLNLGDSYNSQGTNMPNQGGLHPCACQQMEGKRISKIDFGLPPKNLLMIPARVALALQADGWVLRSEIIWHKRNAMPEPVRDRPTVSHEYVFLLSRNQRYFYDQEAIREPHLMTPQRRLKQRDSERDQSMRSDKKYLYELSDEPIQQGNSGGRNKRTVWDIPPTPYKGSHFATWPEKLVEPMILAGTSEKGCCSACGAPWKRQVDSYGGRDWRKDEMISKGIPGELAGDESYKRGQSSSPLNDTKTYVTKGWKPSCDCDAEVSRCVVLDPFSGSATTGSVAMRLGRNYIGIDLNADYLDLAVARLQNRAAPEKVDDTEEESVLDLF